MPATPPLFSPVYNPTDLTGYGSKTRLAVKLRGQFAKRPISDKAVVPFQELHYDGCQSRISSYDAKSSFGGRLVQISAESWGSVRYQPENQ
eukprot:1162092-Rhodomonas_salina.2